MISIHDASVRAADRLQAAVGAGVDENYTVAAMLDYAMAFVGTDVDSREAMQFTVVTTEAAFAGAGIELVAGSDLQALVAGVVFKSLLVGVMVGMSVDE